MKFRWGFLVTLQWRKFSLPQVLCVVNRYILRIQSTMISQLCSRLKFDKDDSITLAEFAFAGHTKAKDSNTGTAFKKVDKDGKYIKIKIYYENHFSTENV